MNVVIAVALMYLAGFISCTLLVRTINIMIDRGEKKVKALKAKMAKLGAEIDMLENI